MSRNMRPEVQSSRTFRDITRNPRLLAMDEDRLGLQDGRTTLIHSKEAPFSSTPLLLHQAC